MERVYSVWDFYDGILSGVADYRGSPHYFEKEWSEREREYLPTFALIPVAEAELAEVVHRERVYREWEARFHRGEVEESSHPGNAGGAASYAELQAMFKARGAAMSPPCRSVPEFVPVPDRAPRAKGVMASFLVVWRDVA